MLSLLTACGIPRDQHQELVEQLEQRNAAYAELQQEREQLQKEKADLQQSMQDTEESLRADISTLENRLDALEERRESLQAELDEANATISMFEDETGGLATALKVTKQDIEELRKERARALERLREYRELAKRLASMVESGQLAVKVRNGKMVIELPNAVLFDPGKTDIKEDGREALVQVADALKTVEDRQFLVAGHTDNVPIQVSGFDSNWELSTERAVEVLQLLQDAGVDPQQLAAAGFGEYEPIASNQTEAGRAQNRRTEIVLMPKIEELPEIPEDLFEQQQQPQASKSE
jgi:chemotaxis protein MotB